MNGLAALIILKDVTARSGGEHEGIDTGATGQRVTPRTPIDGIVSGFAEQRVVAIATFDQVVALAAEDRIGTATDEVVSGPAVHLVIAGVAIHRVVAIAARHVVGARPP